MYFTVVETWQNLWQGAGSTEHNSTAFRIDWKLYSSSALKKKPKHQSHFFQEVCGITRPSTRGDRRYNIPLRDRGKASCSDTGFCLSHLHI